MTDKQLLEQALEALLDSIDDVRDCLNQNLPHAGYARYDRRIEAYREQIKKHEKAIADLTAAIRARLEQPEQEPLGYQYQDGYGNWCNFLGEKHYKDTLASGNFAIRPIYTTPPAAPVQEPVATLIDHYGFTDGVVRFDGVENMEQLPIGTKFYIAPLNVATPLAEQCVCGEPDTPGTHRTDGPCLAEQPAQQQEPVAWVKVTEHWLSAMPRLEIAKPNEEGAKPVYMQPPASKPWVGLTEAEIKECFKITPDQFLPWHIYQRIEAKLKEKNT